MTDLNDPAKPDLVETLQLLRLAKEGDTLRIFGAGSPGANPRPSCRVSLFANLWSSESFGRIHGRSKM